MEKEISVKMMSRCIVAFLAIILAATLVASPAKGKAPAKSKKVAEVREMTGQHYGYMNDKLTLKVADDREVKFFVAIPGDTDWKWHKEFELFSRITVVYHQGPGDALPVVTAIRKVPDAKR